MAEDFGRPGMAGYGIGTGTDEAGTRGSCLWGS